MKGVLPGGVSKTFHGEVLLVVLPVYTYNHMIVLGSDTS